MMSYQVSSAPRPLRERFFGALVTATGWALLCSATQRLMRGTWDLLAWAIGGAVFFLLALFERQNTPSYVLELDDDEIRLVWNGRVRRAVRKDRIRYFHEW